MNQFNWNNWNREVCELMLVGMILNDERGDETIFNTSIQPSTSASGSQWEQGVPLEKESSGGLVHEQQWSSSAHIVIM